MKPPQIQTSPPPLSLANFADFTGGLNYSLDQFDLKPNESPDMLNVVLDPDGGIKARGGLDTQTTAGTVVAANCVIQFANKIVNIPNTSVNGHYFATAGSFTGTALTTPSADFNFERGVCAYDKMGSNVNSEWGWLATNTSAMYKLTVVAGVITFTLLTNTSGGFQDDYGAPSGAHFPASRALAVHRSFMFAAVDEAAQARLRWSHPGDAGSWRSFDYVDIPGDDDIKRLFTMGDHLLILKENSVWALYGNNPDNFELILINDKVGCQIPLAAAKTPYGIFWCDSYQGPQQWTGTEIKWVGEKIFNAFGKSLPLGPPSIASLNTGQMIWMGSNDEEKLHLTIVIGATYYQYVYDPRIEAWSMWRFNNGSFGFGSTFNPPMFIQQNAPTYKEVIGFRRTTTTWYLLNGESEGFGDETGVDIYYTTAWFHGGQPLVRKRWRRAELVIETTGNMTIAVRKGYDDDTDAKTLTLANPSADRLMRTSSLGTARAIQLRFDFPDTTDFSLSNLLLKYRTKPPRS